MKLWPRIYCVYLSVHMCVLDQIIYLELSENQQVRHSKQTSFLIAKRLSLRLRIKMV